MKSLVPDFGRIVQDHQQRIYYLALDLTGNHHDAEDLAQDAFIKAYNALERFRGEARLGTWLYRITVNTHLDRRRGKDAKSMSQQESLDDDGVYRAPLRAVDAAGNPERSAASRDIQRHIESALDQLSPRQRTVFILRHYQQLKLREIAEVLERSEGTVKTTLFRALRRLQEELSFYRPQLGLEESE